MLSDDDDDVSTPGTTTNAKQTEGSTSQLSPKARQKRADKNDDLRKQQNRRAQRDFRQRKQQYIKELEAKVALQGTARDEQIELLGKAIEQLVEENTKLRELLAGVTGFIGEGLGGYLPRLGMELKEFKAIASQTKLDTISSVIDRVLPDAKEAIARQMPSAPGHAAATKRRRLTTTTTDNESSRDTPAGPSQGLRIDTEVGPADVSTSAVTSTPMSANQTLLAPALALTGMRSPNNGSLASVTTSALGQQISRPPSHSSLNLPPLMNPATSAAPPPLTGHYPPQQQHQRQASQPNRPTSSVRDTPPMLTESTLPSSTTSTMERQQRDHLNDAHTREVRAVLPEKGSMSYHDGPEHPAHVAYEQRLQELFNQPTDNPKLQAIQLISYHMRNKREQPSYHLPPSLKATVTQQTVPHSQFFDGIIFPSLRDRLILLKDQYDLQTLLDDLLDAMQIHDNDILLPSNWELSETFLRKYWYVIDAEVLGYTNNWRKQRGEPELTMKSIVPDGKGPVN
ncbi:hypothetical protein OIO90_005415 [Microbotryomycetes sp. JL221]|nr:hypothetical protein OIO90_005415 [Microbotryomycetes sp. JL221]